jgi:kynurenine formamidase
VTTDLPYWPHRSYNWGRWANDLGTLNLLNETTTARAIASVQENTTIALGARLQGDEIANDARTYQHKMMRVGEYIYGPDAEPVQEAADAISVAVHGMTNSHIDAFNHVGHHGKTFNGTNFTDNVSKEHGGSRFTIMDIPAIVTRGWLVDVPRDRGIAALERGTPVTPDDLAVLDGKVEPGDALLVRTGRYRSDVVGPDDPDAVDDHGNWCGLHVDCMELIALWDVATVATDSSGDNFPSTTTECSVPIHVLAETYLGLPLIHHLYLEDLADLVADRSRADFMLVVAPLRIVGGTGSPVNPIAIT